MTIRCMATSVSAVQRDRAGRPAVTARVPLVLADPLVIGGLDEGEAPIAQRNTLAPSAVLADRRVRMLRRLAPGPSPPFRFEVPAGVGRQDFLDLAGTGRMVGALEQAGRAGPLVPQLPRPRQGTGMRAQLALAREEERIRRLPVGPAILLGPHVALRRGHMWHSSPGRRTGRRRLRVDLLLFYFSLLPSSLRFLPCFPLFHDSPFPYHGQRRRL
jgi:hypothetical protein